MALNAGEICLLAAEMAAEHGETARDYALRASVEFEHVGEIERAHFWLIMSVLLDDIVEQRFDPHCPITMH